MKKTSLLTIFVVLLISTEKVFANACFALFSKPKTERFCLPGLSLAHPERQFEIIAGSRVSFEIKAEYLHEYALDPGAVVKGYILRRNNKTYIRRGKDYYWLEVDPNHVNMRTIALIELNRERFIKALGGHYVTIITEPNNYTQGFVHEVTNDRLVIEDTSRSKLNPSIITGARRPLDTGPPPFRGAYAYVPVRSIDPQRVILGLYDSIQARVNMPGANS